MGINYNVSDVSIERILNVGTGSLITSSMHEANLLITRPLVIERWVSRTIHSNQQKKCCFGVEFSQFSV